MKKREDKGYVDIGPSRTQPRLVPGFQWWEPSWSDLPDILPPEYVSPCYVYRNGVLVRVEEPLTVGEVKKLLRTVKQTEQSGEEGRPTIICDEQAIDHLPSPRIFEDLTDAEA